MRHRTAKHPGILSFLFMTEMWERYGFYVVQGLLVLYMTQYFGFSDDASYGILGAFTALAYISPILGGVIADKLLGFRNCILLGGLFLITGYALLALPSAQIFLYPGLATIVVGTGLFKPNISSMLGTQYEEHDPRLDSAFTIFYIGINSGAFLAGISSGYIRDYFGWRMSFGLASLGLIVGMLTFLYGLRYLKHPEKAAPVKKVDNRAALVFYTVLTIVALSLLLKLQKLTSILLPVFGVGLVGFMFYLAFQQKAQVRSRMLVLNTLIVSSVVYWMMYFQMFFSMNLFVDRLVNKEVWGIHLSTTVFYASESVFIILFGPLFAMAWTTLSQRKCNPSPYTKFIWGLAFAGVGMLIATAGTFFPDGNMLIHPSYIFAAYFMITVGELMLSPIGLSAVTTLAPKHLTGLMMGIWFVAIGFGGIFAGFIAKFAAIPSTVTESADKIAIYQSAFLNFACMAFLMAIALVFLRQFGFKKIIQDSL